jgi:hypothetical protein
MVDGLRCGFSLTFLPVVLFVRSLFLRQAKHLIRKLLVKNTEERYTAEQCRNHP